ncbi:MAG: HAD-IA family hydrolase [Halieaceae bacterium]|jgi:N-acetyl-D-muramate 6-phosphate phosphatase|nr:HAD-IA family hydrolase [Halieaceae bacterium]
MSDLPNQLKAVIFDLDGTLIDTAEEFVVVVQALRAEHGRGPLDEAIIRASVSNGARALVTLALDIAESAAEFDSKRRRLLDLYSEVLGTASAPYPGIEALIAALSAQGIAWGIATNKPRAYAAPLLEKLDLSPPMSSLVCSDDVRDRKPHPESLYLSCRHLGCSPHEAIYVGDHLRDIEAGRGAGMYTIAAAYGYIESHDDPSRWGANALASHSTALHSLILGPH